MTKPNNLLLFVFFEYFDCTENIHDNLQIHQGLNQVRTCEHGERPGGSQEGKKLCAFLSLLVGRCVRLVSPCLPLHPFLFPFVGWCVRPPHYLSCPPNCTALGVLNAFLRCPPWSCLPLYPTQCLASCFLFVGWRVRRPGTLSRLFPRCLVPTCVPPDFH